MDKILKQHLDRIKKAHSKYIFTDNDDFKNVIIEIVTILAKEVECKK